MTAQIYHDHSLLSPQLLLHSRGDLLHQKTGHRAENKSELMETEKCDIFRLLSLLSSLQLHSWVTFLSSRRHLTTTGDDVTTLALDKFLFVTFSILMMLLKSFKARFLSAFDNRINFITLHRVVEIRSKSLIQHQYKKFNFWTL